MTAANLYAKPSLKRVRELFATQKEMTELLNANVGRQFQRTFFTLVENGERPVDSELAVVIARILNVKVDDIFTSSKDKTNE
jgi:DNA-binding XRE family transcriptional regulator